MPRGPAPIPIAIKRLRGTVRPDRDSGKVETAPGTPERPSWLTDPEAIARYEQTAGLLRDLGVLTVLDGEAVARYAQTYTSWVDCQRRIKREGLLTKKKMGRGEEVIRLHPACSEAHALASEIAKLEGELGLTPAARSRIRIEAKTPVDLEEAELERQMFGPG